jgi:hypothetical protein
MATTHILLTGKMVAGRGEIDWKIAPLPDDRPQDGELQRMIDEAEMTVDYEDYMADVEFNRRGC